MSTSGHHFPRPYRVTWLDKRTGKRHSRAYGYHSSARAKVNKLGGWPAFFAEIEVEHRG